MPLYVACSRDVSMDAKAMPVLRCILLKCGFRSTEITLAKRARELFSPVEPAAAAEATRRFLGVSSQRLGIDPMCKQRLFKPVDGAPGAHIDPMRSTDPQIYHFANNELGPAARDSQGRLFPAWHLRHLIVQKFLRDEDPRLKVHSAVGLENSKGVFEVIVTPVKRKGPGRGSVTLVSTMNVCIRFSYQLRFREQTRQRLCYGYQVLR